MPPRAVTPAHTLSAEAKAEIKGKKLPIPFSRDAPKFKVNSGEDVRDFFITCDWVFDQAGVTDESTKVELAAMYVQHEQRLRWHKNADYLKGSWSNFKESILSSYSKGKNDPTYVPADLTDALDPYLAKPINNKSRWESFQREVPHIMEHLITSGDLTNRGAIDNVKSALTEGVWYNVLGDLRHEAKAGVAAGTTPTYDFTLAQVDAAVSNYFQTDKWMDRGSKDNTYNRELIPVSTARIKTEELEEYLNRVATLQDVIQKGEKEREESRKADQKMMAALLDTLQRGGQQGLRSQGFVQEAQSIYLQAPAHGVSVPTNLPNGVYKAPPGAFPGNKFVVNDGRCYFCRELGHIVANCPTKEMCESQGHIYKPGGTHIYHVTNGNTSLPIQRVSPKQPLSPWEQVQKFQQENGPKVAAFQSQEDEFASEAAMYAQLPAQDGEFAPEPYSGFGRAQ